MGGVGAAASRDNAAGVRFKKGDAKTVLVEKPFDVAPVKHDPAETALTFRALYRELGGADLTDDDRDRLHAARCASPV